MEDDALAVEMDGSGEANGDEADEEADAEEAEEDEEASAFDVTLGLLDSEEMMDGRWRC